jgi:hypothetical protein
MVMVVSRYSAAMAAVRPTRERSGDVVKASPTA